MMPHDYSGAAPQQSEGHSGDLAGAGWEAAMPGLAELSRRSHDVSAGLDNARDAFACGTALHPPAFGIVSAPWPVPQSTEDQVAGRRATTPPNPFPGAGHPCVREPVAASASQPPPISSIAGEAVAANPDVSGPH